MIEQALAGNITKLVAEFGGIGIFLAMFLESSIVPLPSEVIILGAGAMGVPFIPMLVFGALGSTLGGVAGYLLGRHAAKPAILKFGKFMFIKPHHIDKAEAFARKYGAHSVLFGRLLPIVPFKVFSIAAGITNIALVPFVAYTLVGVLPRIWLLTFFGASIMKYKKIALFSMIMVLAIFIIFKIALKRRKSQLEI